jgi:hypothetical protein
VLACLYCPPGNGLAAGADLVKGGNPRNDGAHEGTRAPGTPAIAFGVPLSNFYQLYFVFPLNEEQQTPRLAQTAVIGAGIAMVALLAAIASLATRMVLPVRHARAVGGP